MGTKVHSKSYLPGYYSVRDLNENANSGSWLPLWGDRQLKNGQYHNSCSPRSMECPNYDKEIIKQTILQHEAIFKKQVYELHRLYKVQNDLMNEIQRKELYKCPIPSVTLQSNAFSYHTPYGDTQKIWQKPALPMMSSSCGGPSMSSIDSRKSQIFLKETSRPLGSFPTQNGRVMDCEILDSKNKNIAKRLFDLQLPAEEFIDTEYWGDDGEGKVLEESLKQKSYISVNIRGKPVNATKLTLGSPYQSKLGLHLREQTQCLADLNIKPVHVESEEAEDAVMKLFSPKAQNKQILRKEPSENEKGGSQWQQYNLEPGLSKSTTTSSYTPVFSQEKFTPSCESIEVELKARELPPFLLSIQNKRQPWFMEQSISGIEIPNTRSDHTISNYSGWAAHPIHVPISTICGINNDNAVSPLEFSSRKQTNCVTHIPVAVQVLPCCNGSAPLNMLSNVSNPAVRSHGFTTEKWDLNNKSKSHVSFVTTGSYPNDFSHIFHTAPSGSLKKLISDSGDYTVNEHTKCLKDLNCSDVKLAKDINLNLSFENGSPHGVGSKKDLMCTNEGKWTDLLGAPSWLGTKVETRQFKSGNQLETCTPQGFFQNSSFALHLKEVEAQRIEMADGLSVKKILGFPLLEKPQTTKDLSGFSFLSVPLHSLSETGDTKNNVKDDFSCIDLSHNCALPELGNQVATNNRGTKSVLSYDPMCSRNDINLNSAVTASKHPTNSLEISCSNNVEVPKTSVLRAGGKATAQVDLEDPVIEELVCRDEECQAPNHFVRSAKAEDSQEMQARIAAEAIIAISSATLTHSKETDCSVLRDPLCWFAKVVSAKATVLDNMVSPLKGRLDGDQESSDEEGLDYFEVMTLKLSDANVDEYYTKPCERDNPEEEEEAPSPLMTRSRKGQRRGRQRRDFRKDILPGLASLSRHEVTEDLQIIGELMRASGCSWQAGLTRRNKRNGWNCSTRGRQRPRVLNVVDPPPQRNPNNCKVELDGIISLQGWGKTTRRARRLRYPTSNIAALLT